MFYIETNNIKNIKDILNKEYFLIEFKKESSVFPFLDNNKYSYFFEKEENAEKFLNKFKTLKLQIKKCIIDEEEIKDLLKYGVENIIIFNKNNEIKKYHIFKGITNKEYILNNTIRNLVLFKESNKVKYLRALLGQKFIILAKVENNFLKYATVDVGENKENKFYFCFTDIESYKKWKEENKDKKDFYFWKPLEIETNILKEIVKNNNIIINPSEQKIFLTRNMIEKIKEKK